jgi:heme-degrading monooxygenase HmoA
MLKKWILLPLTLLLMVTSACKIGPPFYRTPALETGGSPEDKVVVGLTYVKTGKNRQAVNRFWSHVTKVNSAMKSQPGYLGGAIRRQIFGKQGWTMSVWKDHASLDAFVESEYHQKAIREGMAGLDISRFARIEVRRDEVPLSWKRVEEVLTKYGWEYDETVMRGYRKNDVRPVEKSLQPQRP